MNAEKRLLSIGEIARHLGVSVSTIYSWVNQRKIRYVKVGRLVKFDLADIEAWISAHKMEVHKHWDNP